MRQPSPRRFVWDLPTRLFHWLLVALVGFSWWSASTDHMDWHLSSGLAVLGLVVFRILWGLVGASTSRFHHFLKGPRAIWSYMRPAGAAVRTKQVGHNPLGGWSVAGLLLLLLLSVQVVSGLLAVDVDGIESGPLSYLVDFDQGRSAATIHALSFRLLQALVVLHVAAILFYLVVKRRNLTRAMVTGYQASADGDRSADARPAPRWRAAAALAVAALLTYAVADGFRF